MNELKTGTPPRLVTHFIAGYPSLEASFETAKGLIDGGAYALEMQIPFSDPSADGPVIELACRGALEKGFRVADGFKLVERIREYADVSVYIMSYSAIVFNMGIEDFAERAAAVGVTGLIIPDLTPGTDEGLYEAGRKFGLDIVPVIVPEITEQRLEDIISEKSEWAYLALRSGITGSYTELDDENLGFLDRLKEYDVRVMAGFGIRSPEQIQILHPHCDAAIVGSYIVSRITESWNKSKNTALIYKTAFKTVEYLLSS